MQTYVLKSGTRRCRCNLEFSGLNDKILLLLEWSVALVIAVTVSVQCEFVGREIVSCFTIQNLKDEVGAPLGRKARFDCGLW